MEYPDAAIGRGGNANLSAGDEVSTGFDYVYQHVGLDRFGQRLRDDVGPSEFLHEVVHEGVQVIEVTDEGLLELVQVLGWCELSPGREGRPVLDQAGGQIAHA